MPESDISLWIPQIKRSYYDEKNSSYLLPNGLDENDRLIKQHIYLCKYFEGNFHPPIEQNLQSGIKVLDSGCGPGIWTVDMAKSYPKSSFHGIDMANVVPDEWKLYKNAEFTTGNITKDILYENNSIDFIYQRLVFVGLNRNDWINSINNFYRVLKPGGYVEFLEVKCYDFENAGPLVNKLTDTFLKTMNARKMVPRIDIELEQFVKDAGFININIIRKDLPMNYDGEEGKLLWDNFYRVFDGYGPFLIEYNDKWNDISDFEAHMVKCREEILETRSLFKYFVIYAQKPFE